jgi:hypothetical protein
VTTIRKPPSFARPRVAEPTGPASVTDTDTPRPGRLGMGGDAPVEPGRLATGGSQPARGGGHAATIAARRPDLRARIARILRATDEEDFVDRVCNRLSAAIVDLDALLADLEDDGRVGEAYRRALATQLGYYACEYLEQWQSDLLEGLDADEG